MLLLHDTMQPLSERQCETLRRMQQGTERIRRLVDDVLDFSQLASGKLALCAQSVCLREAVQSAEFVVALFTLTLPRMKRR